VALHHNNTGKEAFEAADVAPMVILARVLVLLATVVAGLTPHVQPGAPLPPGVPYAAPGDPVRIESVQLSSNDVKAGDVASGLVITTSNAAAMLARVGSYQVNVPRVNIGTFALSVRVPWFPLPVYHTTIVVIAIRADGATAQQTVSLKVHY
jgi:hypothetical protein